MPIADRMKLAEGRPLRRRMMAAMAQQDCGQCGYNCNDYSDAIAGKSEARLNLCVPGGKETARMLKALNEELEKAPASAGAAVAPIAAAPAVSVELGRSRDNPVPATFVSRRLLNKHGSEKETWHIDFDLSGCGLDYVVGDSFGIMPVNDPMLVDAVIAADFDNDCDTDLLLTMADQSLKLLRNDGGNASHRRRQQRDAQPGGADSFS